MYGGRGGGRGNGGGDGRGRGGNSGGHGGGRSGGGRGGRSGGRSGGGSGGGRGRGGHGGGGRGRGGHGGGRGRGGHGGGGRGRGRGNYRGGRGGMRSPRRSADSGNKRERIAVESGHLVLIDQFMLANPQFISKMIDLIDDEPERKDEVIKEYGGTVVDLAPGMYRIQRDPFAFTIIVHPQGEHVETEELSSNSTATGGRVFVDTRCLAMIDRELLDDSGLLEKYQQLWAGGKEKACRDLLRDNGGAVRYGFQRYGDELGVYKVNDEDVVCLWPDVTEDVGVEPTATETPEPVAESSAA